MNSSVSCIKPSIKKVDEQIVEHMPQSFQLMFRIDELANEKLDELLEPVRRGEMTLEELKRSRGLL
ncbi:hypothetical protein SAMN04488589_2763 [Methanolobus vulcani]|uniref:Uncharacterized protein n=1 Tax=Methanolobus vulcani TaxID=38026 RepID=A0A7Z7FDR3_9EURY|nr:hypothetical protein [Methanolobus vulcani]SDG34583.1 hypothetical protein SAMN04488589_2763 [Methanolobus vulcani]